MSQNVSQLLLLFIPIKTRNKQIDTNNKYDFNANAKKQQANDAM